jgi:glycosyltransferase involved in cell wall biosynthesis
VGFITRLVTRKGVDVLLDALVLLRDRGGLPRTALVGNGDRRNDLIARIADEGLSDRVIVRPFATPVWPKLAALDVFVLPSLWDVFPIAVLEAMAAGLPVVASATGGLPEAVDDGVTGLLVEPGQAASLADAIARLVADADLRSRMGAAGREAYERRFQPSQMVDAIEDIYVELLRSASAPSGR